MTSVRILERSDRCLHRGKVVGRLAEGGHGDLGDALARGLHQRAGERGVEGLVGDHTIAPHIAVKMYFFPNRRRPAVSSSSVGIGSEACTRPTMNGQR